MLDIWDQYLTLGSLPGSFSFVHSLGHDSFYISFEIPVVCARYELPYTALRIGQSGNNFPHKSLADCHLLVSGRHRDISH